MMGSSSPALLHQFTTSCSKLPPLLPLPSRSTSIIIRCCSAHGGPCAAADSPSSSRRCLLLAQLASASLLPLVAPPRSGLGLGAGPGLAQEEEAATAAEEESLADRTITDRVYMDIVKCPSSFSTSRDNGSVASSSPSPSPSPSPSSPQSSATATASSATASSATATASSATASPGTPSAIGYCHDREPVGRIVIGLYGKQVPETVAIFKAMCTGGAGSSYKGCLLHRVLAGQYIMAGKQGLSKEKGEVSPPTRLPQNLDTVKPEAFKLRHSRPGTVSLCLSENDDDDSFRLSTDYRNVEFLITTGPGPAPQLDNKNIVFGIVLEGLDVVRALATVPTYKPGERIRQLNELASFLGDERASNARNFWYRPLTALYISDCGVL